MLLQFYSSLISMFNMSLISLYAIFMLLHMSNAAPLCPNSAKNACKETKYSDICAAMLSEHLNDSFISASTACEIGMKATAPKVEAALNLVQNYMGVEHGTVRAVLQVCQETISDAYDDLTASISRVDNNYIASNDPGSDDVWTWMSAVVTEHTTCMEVLQKLGSSCPEPLQENAKLLQMDLSNTLGLFVSMRKNNTLQREVGSGKAMRKLQRSGEKNEKAEENALTYELDDGLPNWMPPERRRHILQSSSPTIVVALDGTGSFRSIQQAVDSASPGSVIYVKKGVYHEYVEVYKNKSNLVITGDGMHRTIITGNRSYAEVGTTFKTPTVAIKASGFIGKNLAIENTAGPQNHQAVALLVTADQVAFFNCSFLAYQDTLYTHAYRQFYRECHVEGTIDFIFGNAAAVFQRCTIWARQSTNKNFVTAQGRTDPNQNTGLSFQQCYIDGSSGTETYLGRPWKDYSRTVFMQSYLTKSISSQGWYKWENADYRNQTVFYGEYLNSGDGASTFNRVSWSKTLSMAEASNFTVVSFIGGHEWLPSTGITYQGGLM